MLSLCMIVKDEEKFLPGCLKSVKEYIDEIIIVDTGSTDRSIDIAGQYGAKVFEHPWENDFAKHRNQSIAYAKGDWILILDADEEVIHPGGSILRKALHDETADSIAIQVINLINKGTGFATFNSVRIFRNHIGIRYEGIVHNKEVGCSSTKFYPIRILHHGYNFDEAKMRAKFDRTTSLLKKQIAEEPYNPLPHHYLAVSYMSMGSYDSAYYHNAIGESNLAIALAGEKLNNNVIYLGTHYVAAASHFNLGNMDEAEAVCREALKICIDHLDSHYLLSRIYDTTGNYQEAYYSSGRYLAAREAIEKYPEQFGQIINNSFTEAWLITIIRGKSEYETNSKRNARKIFTEVVEEYPRNWNGLVSIGHFYFNKSEFKEAEYFLAKANKIKKDKMAYYMLCECHSQLGQTDAQIRSLSEIIDQFPGEMGNIKKIGMAQLRKSHYKVASFCLSKAAEKGDVSPEIIEALKLAKLQLVSHLH